MFDFLQYYGYSTVDLSLPGLVPRPPTPSRAFGLDTSFPIGSPVVGRNLAHLHSVLRRWEGLPDLRGGALEGRLETALGITVTPLQVKEIGHWHCNHESGIAHGVHTFAAMEYALKAGKRISEKVVPSRRLGLRA